MNPRAFQSVGEVADVDSGPAFRSSHFGAENEGIPLLRGENIEPGALRWSKVRTWPQEMLSGYEHLFVESGDLILGMDRPIVSAGLKLAEVHSSDLPALLVQRVARIRPKFIHGRYLYYWLSSPAFTQHLRRSATGTQLPHVTLASIRDFAVPRFSSAEEARIVEILENHLSRLDAARQGLDIASAKLSALREQTIMNALTGAGIADRSEAALLPAGTADGRLPSLPSGWLWARLGDVADVVGGVTKDSKKETDPSYVEVPYLRVANVQRGKLDLTDVASIRVPVRKAEELLLQRGDVLLNEGGDRDKLARGWVWEGQVGRCIHQNHVFRARIREPRLDSYFLSWTANTFGGRWAERNGKQSVNLASISRRMILNMPVIVPAEGEAARIVEKLGDELHSYSRLEAALRVAYRQSEALRRSLLAAAFSGRLTAQAEESMSLEFDLVPA